MAYRGNMKKRMQRADEARARFVAILGDDELANDQIILKDLASGQQQTMPQSGLLNSVKAAA
jgi:histidyl-tRNA synthetase